MALFGIITTTCIRRWTSIFVALTRRNYPDKAHLIVCV